MGSKQPMSKKEIFITLLIALPVMVYFILGSADDQAGTPEPDNKIESSATVEEQKESEEPDKTGVWTAARMLVKRRLRSPSTADFGGISEYQDPEVQVKELENSSFEVYGWVDSQNGFGATIRTRWQVVVRESEDGKSWQAVEGPYLGDEIGKAFAEKVLTNAIAECADDCNKSCGEKHTADKRIESCTGRCIKKCTKTVTRMHKTE